MSELLVIDDCMSPGPYTVSPGHSATAAMKLMNDHEIRHLPVVEDGSLMGIVSMRDIYMLQASGKSEIEAPLVGELMKRAPYAVQTGTSLREVAINMNAHKYGCTVVKDGTKVVGVFTTVDAMRVLANLVE